jgi:hypothetical protein
VAAYLSAETALLMGDPTNDVEVDLAIRRPPLEAAAPRRGPRSHCRPAQQTVRRMPLRPHRPQGFDTLCRRSELVVLHAEGLQPNYFGTASRLIRRAKNDPYGAERITHLTPVGLDALRSGWRPPSMIMARLCHPVYQSVVKSRNMKPFALTRILKKLATAGAGRRNGLQDLRNRWPQCRTIGVGVPMRPNRNLYACFGPPAHSCCTAANALSKMSNRAIDDRPINQ